MKALTKWAFAMAFVSIGLELSIKALGKMKWRSINLDVSASVRNTLLSLRWGLPGPTLVR